MTEPTTPVVSAARREQVIDALIWNHHISEDGDIPFVAMADAAIAALLPDRAAFDEAVDRLMVASLLAGADGKTGNETSMERKYLAELRSLVYGDDAQAGEVGL